MSSPRPPLFRRVRGAAARRDPPFAGRGWEERGRGGAQSPEGREGGSGSRRRGWGALGSEGQAAAGLSSETKRAPGLPLPLAVAREAASRQQAQPFLTPWTCLQPFSGQLLHPCLLQRWVALPVAAACLFQPVPLCSHPSAAFQFIVPRLTLCLGLQRTG